MNKWLKILPVILVVILLGVFAYLFFSKWHEKEVEIAVEEQRTEWREKEKELKEKIVQLEEEQKDLTLEPGDAEKLAAVLGETPSEPISVTPETRCQQAEKRIASFFNYLDGRDYIQAYHLEKGSYHEFMQISALLSENPPRISGETGDLMSLMHNISHFNRILKKKRLRMVKDIIEKETGLSESMMAAFYYWTVSDDQCAGILAERPSEAALYDYAVFFLNTLGGKSYLSRRGAKVRTLTLYYSILALDRANDEKQNRNGVDIRPHIKQLYTDLRYQKGLAQKNAYLRQLEGLMQKYRI